MGLKDKLGEELFTQANEKLGEDEKLILNDGSYIPKEKFDEANEKAKQLENQISERDKQIEQLKNDTQASDELKSKIEELQEQNEKTKEELSNKLQQQRMESEIDKALLKNKARNPKAVKALLDLESVELNDDGVKGLDDQLNKIKESESYLFEQEDNSSAGGNDFRGGGDKPLTMAQVDQMSEKEINDNWDEVSKVLEANK